MYSVVALGGLSSEDCGAFAFKPDLSENPEDEDIKMLRNARTCQQHNIPHHPIRPQLHCQNAIPQNLTFCLKVAFLPLFQKLSYFF